MADISKTNLCCVVAVGVLWLYVIVPWVGLQCVNVVFPDHKHLLFVKFIKHYSLYILASCYDTHFVVKITSGVTRRCHNHTPQTNLKPQGKDTEHRQSHLSNDTIK